MKRIDLLLIHWPLPRLDLYVETWRAMIEMRAEGLVRSIGVSNFTPAHITRLQDATGVTPAVNQVEMHPRFVQEELRTFHAEHGIRTESCRDTDGGVLCRAAPVAAGVHGAVPANGDPGGRSAVGPAPETDESPP